MEKALHAGLALKPTAYRLLQIHSRIHTSVFEEGNDSEARAVCMYIDSSHLTKISQTGFILVSRHRTTIDYFKIVPHCKAVKNSSFSRVVAALWLTSDHI